MFCRSIDLILVIENKRKEQWTETEKREEAIKFYCIENKEQRIAGTTEKVQTQKINFEVVFNSEKFNP